MLSEKFMCHKCGQEKPIKEKLLPIETFEEYEGLKLHFFCLTCGSPYQVEVVDGQYQIGEINAEE